MTETMIAPGTAAAANTRSAKKAREVRISPRLIDASQRGSEAALALLNTADTGLGLQEVERRREQYGKNEVAHEKPPTWYVQFLHAFVTPFNGILAFIAGISLFADVILAVPEDRSYETIIVLAAMILLSTILRFWQEFRSNQAAEKLKALVRTSAAVLRQGSNAPKEIPVAELVPGRETERRAKKWDDLRDIAPSPFLRQFQLGRTIQFSSGAAPGELVVGESLPAAPVRCSDLFGSGRAPP